MRTLALAALTITFGATLFGARAHAQEAPLTARAPAPAPPAEAVPPPAPPPAPVAQAPYYPAQQPAPYYGQYPAQPYYVPTAAAARPRLIGYRTEERSVKAMWVPGMVAFLAGWVLNFGVATPLANAISNDRDGAVEEDAWAWSLVPLAGPLVQLGIGAPHPAIPLVMLTLQGVGLGMLIAGLVMKETVRLPVYEGDPHDPNATRIDLSAIPVEGGAQVGLTLTHL